MMSTTARGTGRFELEISAANCEIIAAGKKDPVFGSFQPDAYTAYVKFKLSKSLPMVTGPESLTGALFGIHPGVIARSFESLRHKQSNFRHRLKMYGAAQNAFVGCVLQVAFPEAPEGGWEVPATVEEAPSIEGIATLFKQDSNVKKIIGEHLGAPKNWSVSMEVTYVLKEVGVYDPATRVTYDRADIPAAIRGYLTEDKDGRLAIKKGSNVPQLVLALGGVTGSIFYSGFGYTEFPAESTAGIEAIAAEKREGMLVCQIATQSEWAPGMTARWGPVPGGYSGGIVREVIEEGARTSHGRRFVATPDNPLLVCELPDRRTIIRRASSLANKN